MIDEQNIISNFFGDDSTTSVAASDHIDKNMENFTAEEEEINLAEAVAKAEADKLAQETKEGDFFSELGTPNTAEDDKDKAKAEVETPEEIAAREAAESEVTTEVDSLTVIKEMIDEGVLLGFEDSEIETVEDLKNLIKANIEEAKVAPKEEEIAKYFDSLPEEIKLIKDYAEKGASPDDIRGMFKAFAEVQEVKTIDINTEEGQKEIARQYLTATKFGSLEEINEEINDWIDLGKLEKRAASYQPKLESMRDQIVQEKLAQQDRIKEQQREIQANFTSSIEKVLAKPDIVNIKLPKVERDKLVKELTQNNYSSSINGRPLNGLGKVLEDVTFVNPNPGFLAELTYFATNPESFIQKLTEKIKEQEAGKTVRKLKTSTPQSSNEKKVKGHVYRPINEI